MLDLVARVRRARPEVTAELLHRGMFTRAERAELQSKIDNRKSKIGSVQLATLLAQGDTQLAARAVLRNVLEPDELRWLDRLLSFPRKRESSKLNELRRVVERGLEGRKGNARRSR